MADEIESIIGAIVALLGNIMDRLKYDPVRFRLVVKYEIFYVGGDGMSTMLTSLDIQYLRNNDLITKFVL